ncbi:ankyrin repeat, SAM and basic leucine zipper domain-containing protein 1 [Nelusetta ayraudi]|uniref:ankyrin repeat, SAM and basic leucine zipper domain-containing protein 1 n=1 Tax=Nelusetta ayraudi TaxID=303726 RepID=UPI003F727693
MAISKGDKDAVEMLLDGGMDVDTKLGFGWSPLMCAVNVANFELAKLLLNRGANASLSKDHWTVLMASITASAREDQIASCVDLLLSRKADPNVADRSKTTCLMLAAREGYTKVINLLVSHGAELDSQDGMGFTALYVAVQHSQQEAVLKLLQLGADKSIKSNAGKSPMDLASSLKKTQMRRILSSTSHVATLQASGSVEENLSKFFKTNTEPPSSNESVAKMDEVELLLHGLELGHLADIMVEHDITWGYLVTMEEEDLQKMGVTDPSDQQKLLRAVKQMHLDQVDLETISQLGVEDASSEDLQSFLISLRKECCHLTEVIRDVNVRFPRHRSQLVFTLDPKKEAQAICNQVIIQTKDLQKEVVCLRNLLGEVSEAADGCGPPPAAPRSSRRSLSSVALSALGAAAVVLLLCRTARAQAVFS